MNSPDGHQIERTICQFWQKALELERPPSASDNFFALGGDSAAAVSLITMIEECYAVDVPITKFFLDPSVSQQADMVREAVSNRPHGCDMQGTPISEQSSIGLFRKLKMLVSARCRRSEFEADNAQCQETSRRDKKPVGLLREMGLYVSSWRGERPFEDSLILGLNTSGSGRPLFWVFQGYEEFKALADCLGDDQPLYGMRSCHEIVPVEDCNQETIEEIVNRYLWEILALAGDKPIILGGNCQGALVALLIAQRLKQVRRSPALLILMEWSFSLGIYSDPVLLLYGEESDTANIYGGEALPDINWRTNFPKHFVRAIPGKHGTFFSEVNVRSLAAVITHFNRHSTIGLSGSTLDN